MTDASRVAWTPFLLSHPWQSSTLSVLKDISSDLILDIEPLRSIEPVDNHIIVIPDLEQPDTDAVQPSPASLCEDEAPKTFHSNDEYDCWSQDFVIDPLSTRTPLRSWDTIRDSTTTVVPRKYISEQGEDVFDALAHRLRPSIGILPQNVALRALCNLCLGRSSIQYQWNSHKDAFETTLSHSTIAGCSMTIAESIVSTVLKQGTLLRRLRDLTLGNTSSSAILTTFSRAIARIVDTIEAWIATKLSTIQSILQLDRIVRAASRVLEFCSRIHASIGSSGTATIISTLSTTLRAMDSIYDLQTPIMAAILQDVLVPWMQLLLQEIGLSQSTTLIHGESLVDDTAISTLTSEDRALAASIIREREILKQHNPENPVFKQCIDASSTRTVDEIVNRARQLEASLITTLAEHKSAASVLEPAEIGSEIAQTWSAFDPVFVEDSLLDVEATAQPGKMDDLTARTTDALEGRTSNALDNNLNILLDTAAYVRPILNIQRKIVNQAMLTLLFDTCKLTEVLELHRATFLYGSADFMQRLTNAFFEDHSDSDSHNRRRRKGLRLNALSKTPWPPSSSDLSLNLMGILDDNNGKLSFAVRELSEAEILKTCDADSINALDFIRLQYTVSAPLANIFTTSSSKWYDEIFSTLLLHTRMLHLITQVRQRLLHSKTPMLRGEQGAKSRAHFTTNAYHLVTALVAYAVEVAVNEPWQQLQVTIARAESEFSTSTVSLELLHNKHMQCLEHIRRGLFISRRYDGICQAQHALYGFLLKHRTVLLGTSNDSITHLVAKLEELTQRLLSILTLTRDRVAGIEDAQSEADRISILLNRLV